MLLIADGGATQVKWACWAQPNHVQYWQTTGLNPYQQPDTLIEDILKKELLPQLPPNQVHQIYFYGAGCHHLAHQKRLLGIFKTLFPMAQAQIASDILGAARAVFGSDAGLIGILGTGANISAYDGAQIVNEDLSLGYVLGDEGSGAYFGKLLVANFLNQGLPLALQQAFAKAYPLTRETVLREVYQSPFPNRYLAGFMPFLQTYQHDPYVDQLLRQGFGQYFDKYVLRLPEASHWPLCLNGSVAWHFRDILAQEAQKRKLPWKAVVKDPLEGLVAFHQKHTPIQEGLSC
ncbi:MAG: ATPase [Microscillaceae bacterium]